MFVMVKLHQGGGSILTSLPEGPTLTALPICPLLSEGTRGGLEQLTLPGGS